MQYDRKLKGIITVGNINANLLFMGLRYIHVRNSEESTDKLLQKVINMH